MSRLWSSGFELNTNTSNVEFTSAVGSPSIQTSIVRTGTYAGRVTAPSTNTPKGWKYTFNSADLSTDIYVRFYLYIASLPNVTTTVGLFFSTNLSNGESALNLSSTGVLSVLDNAGTTLGSSSALNTGQWYRIEHRNFNTSTTIALLIDGATIVQSTVASTSTYNQYQIGANLSPNTATACDLYFDDWAINNTTGTNQSSYPGAGGITHLQPNATGDNNAFTVQVGGSAGSTNNYTRVSEVTPDDATSYNGDTVSGDIDDFNLTDTPAAIGATDIISVVSVGVRYRAVIAAGESPFVVRCKKASAGTVSESSAITPNSTTWTTNANAIPLNYPLVLYADPDSLAWDKATLDTAQIGYRITSLGTNATDISTVWLQIDSTPAIPIGHQFNIRIKPIKPVISWNNPITRGLVFDAPFFERGGTVITDLVSNTTGTLTPGTGGWVTDLYGSALSFDGSTSSLHFATHPYQDSLTKVSYEMLYYMKGYGGGNLGRLFVKSNGNAPGYFQAQMNSAAVTLGCNQQYSTSNASSTIPTPTQNVWHHIVFTCTDPNTASVYLDGVLQSSTNTAGVGSHTGDSADLFIGNTQSGTRAWNGYIGYFRQWKRILNVQEIKQLYSNPWQIYAPYYLTNKDLILQ